MRALYLALIAAVVAGCAFGRTASYSETAIAIPAADGSGTIAVAVQDKRPYVLSGKKPEHFVGLMRGGFGNPFDVNTSSGGPLAADLSSVMSRSLVAKGYKVKVVALAPQESAQVVKAKLAEAAAKRSALLTLTEWKSDTMMNIGILYDATLAILNENGEQLATSSIRGKDNLGYAGISPEPAIMAGFARKLELLFGDPGVVAALK
ncbi:MAG: hypothetical protein WA190_03430 [Usitatibacter sp.]